METSTTTRRCLDVQLLKATAETNRKQAKKRENGARCGKVSFGGQLRSQETFETEKKHVNKPFSRLIFSPK